MREAVIVEAVRTPIARGKPGVGDLCDFHATQLLALSYRELLRRSGLAMADVDYLAAGRTGEKTPALPRNVVLPWVLNSKTDLDVRVSTDPSIEGARLVLGENVSQAAQFALSGSAQAGIFTEIKMRLRKWIPDQVGDDLWRVRT